MSVPSLNVFPFEADWSQPPKLRIAFATGVQRGDNGAEERDSLCIEPTLSVGFAVASDADHSTAQAVARWGRKNLGVAALVPLWSEEVAFTSRSVNTINCAATLGTLFKTVAYAMLWKGPGSTDYLAFEIGSVNANSITSLTTLSGSDWIGVVPLIQTEVLTEGKPVAWWTDCESMVEVDFAQDATTAQELVAAATPPTFASLPIWPLDALWAEDGVPGGDVVPSTAITAPTGVRATTILSTLPRRSMEWPFQIHGRTEIDAVLAFFDAVRGRWGRFWLPSQKREFIPVADHDGSDTVVCEPSGYVASGEDSGNTRRALLIRMAAGTWHARKIVNATLNLDDNEALQLNDTIPAGDIWSIEWLYLARLETDDLVLAFLDTTHADMTLSAVELPHEYAEVLASADATSGTIADGGLLQ